MGVRHKKKGGTLNMCENFNIGKLDQLEVWSVSLEVEKYLLFLD